MNGKQKSVSFNIPKRKSVVRIIVEFFSSYVRHTCTQKYSSRSEGLEKVVGKFKVSSLYARSLSKG